MRMHATRDPLPPMFLRRARGRVMPGVRCFSSSDSLECKLTLWRLIFSSHMCMKTLNR